MDYDSDLEGEAHSSICEDFDPLDDIGYLDERIESALGHLQKAFEGGILSAELLGPKYGGYGTFLSSNEDSLPAPLHRGTSQTSPIIQSHSSCLPGKNAVWSLRSLQSASCKIKSHRDDQRKRDSGSPSIQTPGNDSLKKGSTMLRANDASDHRPIRVRIKMGSEILSRKVAVVCRDLGIDDSPDSTPENSRDDNCRMLPHISLDTPNESPSSILRIMTSVPVPEGLLMSPLPYTLLHAMEKPKQETINNELVVKVPKELPVLSPGVLSDVLVKGKTLNGKKKRVLSSIDGTTCKESSSLEEIKKQRKLPAGQRYWENSTFGSGGASFSNDSSTFKNKLQKYINKDGESDREVALKKSNKIKVSGVRLKDPVLVSLEELKKASPAKSKESVCNNRLGAKLVSMPFKDAGSEVAPPSTSLELDNWVQCDSCQTWRLLPSGMKPEQLPDKWSCSMQIWLPHMNHCGLSQEETANAVILLHQNSGSETHNLKNGVINLVSDAGRMNQSRQLLTSGLLPQRINKKSTEKDVSKGDLGIAWVEAASSMRSNLQVPIQMNTAENARQISEARGLGMLCDFDDDKNVTEQKAKRLEAGTAHHVRFKRIRVSDQQESDNSKNTKVDDGNKLPKKIKTKETPWKLNLGRITAERRTKPSENGFSTVDMKRNTEKKVLPSIKKVYHQSLPTTAGDSLAGKAYDKTIAPAKKKKMENKDNFNSNDSESLADGDNKVYLNKKDKKAKVSIVECKKMKTCQRNGMHQADEFREHAHSDTSSLYFSSERGLVSGTSTLSSSKVSESHKSGMAHAEVKALLVESISSSPTRSSCPKDFSSAGESISRRSQNLQHGSAGSRIVNNRAYLEGDCECESITHSRNDKQSKLKICNQNSKFGDLASTNRNTASGQNQVQDYPSESKAGLLQSPVSLDNASENRAAIKKANASTHGTMDCSYQVANDVLKEANKLRTLANCLKSSGFERENREVNFKASLKFLYGASLLEMCSAENVLNEKMNHVETYRIAAKLSESCALEYEANQEMAAAALAYKCTEVACMRMIYGRSLGASRDWNSLQKMLQMAPKGESPSSSVSDMDSFNHQVVVDKSSFSKGGIPHIGGKHLNVARSHQNVVQLLDFAEDMNMAMEASMKSQDAFNAAIVTLEGSQFKDCISSIKRVINFSFHNVEALKSQVEQAMDGLSHSTSCGIKY